MKYEITFENSELIANADVRALFMEHKKLTVRMKALEIKLEQFKEELMQAMKDNDVKGFDTEYVKVTYVPEHTAERLDSKALKAEHPKIAKKYTKESVVKESLRVIYK